MSNDLLKLVHYIGENKNEYDFLMNEYERLINYLDYEKYSVEFLIKLVSTFENFETSHKDVNKQKRRFLKNVIKNIKFMRILSLSRNRPGGQYNIRYCE